MIKIYDSHSKKKEDFKPLKEGEVKMYVCGPTVYDVAHLGHGRSAVAFDVIRKYFEYRGFNVTFVSNYTDIDDKMIKRAAERGISVEQLKKEVIPEYEKDYGDLGVKPPDVQPCATDYIPQIVEMIGKLEANGLTYVLDDGVYFDVEKFPAYGELSGQNLDELKMGARVEVNSDKKNPYDFALWKLKKEGEPSWPSPWGDGRPGWHIECSAMSFANLGETFDIHGGGLDLLFPHHECEVAQSHGVFGPDSFARYWIHNGFINVNEEKMSKSLGNFSTLKEIFEKYDPMVVRFMFLQTHYRNPINFSTELLDQAKAGLERIHGFVRGLKVGYEKLKPYIELEEDFDHAKIIAISERQKFDAFMDNDFDTSGSLGVVFDLINRFNGLKSMDVISKEDVDGTESFLKEVDKVFGFIFPKEEALSEDIEALIAQREEARKNKDFAKSDKIRDDLLKKGIVLEDTPDGTVWKKA
ncbi:MAG: cysteine--tRNA ligase [Candidatus Peregrinibacteria bacterium]